MSIDLELETCRYCGQKFIYNRDRKGRVLQITCACDDKSEPMIANLLVAITVMVFVGLAVFYYIATNPNTVLP